MAIKLLVGLGNPGPEYENTRHNAGFWLAEAYVRESGASLKSEKGFFGKLGKTSAAWVLMPMTFMNRSGDAVASLARFYKIAPEEILVVHDELDLLPGIAKIKKGGSNAGHNGLKDITAKLGTADFWRLRIGIGHPRSLGLRQEVIDFVLHPPRREEQDAIDDCLNRCLNVLPDALGGRMEAAMLKLHTKA